jgi:hypothetical protein
MRTTLIAAAALAALTAPAQAGLLDFVGRMTFLNPPTLIGAPPCPPGFGLVRQGDGEGGVGVADGLSNLGAFEPRQRQCGGPPNAAGVRPIILGTFEWTFAAGDVLRGTYSGEVPPLLPMPTQSFPFGTMLVDGGEGRFRHATGVLDFDAVVTFLGPSGNRSVWDVVGTIDTPAPGALALFGLGLAALAAGRGRTAR